MRLLVITNLFPPQELGGYGRCLSDFVWGLKELGHYIKVVTSDAPYLNKPSLSPCSDVPDITITRHLKLKGSYESGISILDNPVISSRIDKNNISVLSDNLCDGWDGVLLGNLDLIGIEILPVLLRQNIPILHHIGFVSPPFAPHPILESPNYHILPASQAVALSLQQAGFSICSNNVVYPGARIDLFQPRHSSYSSSLSFAFAQETAGHSIGSPSNPLKVGFAGLLMGSKGLHTLIQALILLKQQGYSVQANFAGDSFQSGYIEQLEQLILKNDCLGSFNFVGCLSRNELIRFWSRHHIGIFPSIHPEAFGISAAEILSSGLLLISSGVGGASELFTPGEHGLLFKPDNPSSLLSVLLNVLNNPGLLRTLSRQGFFHVRDHFSVSSSSLKLESLFKSLSLNL